VLAAWLGKALTLFVSQAYSLPSSLSESSFRIGKREQTCIAAEAASAASKPGPGQYKVDVHSYVGAVKLGATSGRERSLDKSSIGKPGPGAYTPELPGSTAISIGTRRKTIIDEEASKAASKPGPGQYKNEARWDHVGSVKLGATAGREKPVVSVPSEVAAALRPPPVPGPGVRGSVLRVLLYCAAHFTCLVAGLLAAVVAVREQLPHRHPQPHCDCRGG
jgi:hypothetical protein